MRSVLEARGFLMRGGGGLFTLQKQLEKVPKTLRNTVEPGQRLPVGLLYVVVM